MTGPAAAPPRRRNGCSNCPKYPVGTGSFTPNASGSPCGQWYVPNSTSISGETLA